MQAWRRGAQELRGTARARSVVQQEQQQRGGNDGMAARGGQGRTAGGRARRRARGGEGWRRDCRGGCKSGGCESVRGRRY